MSEKVWGMGEVFDGWCSLVDGEQRLTEVAAMYGNNIRQRVSGFGWIKIVSFERGHLLIAYDPEQSTTEVRYHIWVH